MYAIELTHGIVAAIIAMVPASRWATRRLYMAYLLDPSCANHSIVVFD